MRIGFDSKRMFHNFRGLGNFSRTLIRGLVEYYPDNELFLYTPPFSRERTKEFQNALTNSKVKILTPQGFIAKNFPSLWRSFLLKGDLKNNSLDLFHGLSHELPIGINSLNLKKVVTIHDLIFLKRPDFFSPIDRMTYKRKYLHSCKHADLIHAISEQTKGDLINDLKIPEKKIKVIYQAADPIFFREETKTHTDSLRKKYNLPARFFLFVGALERNKNVINLIHSFYHFLNTTKEGHLLFFGRGNLESEMKELVRKFKIEERVIIHQNYDFSDLPGIYHLAKALVFPSFVEGFGLPIIEGLAQGTPAVTSKIGPFSEAGGPGAIYIDPNSQDDMAQGLLDIWDEGTREKLSKLGNKYVQKFSLQETTKNLMNFYQSIN